ncbi:hypothetical protein CL654_02515 [bacterium]|nr:hypothetical protein [bacterium]|tara:strand:- start:890 stop:1111 length:222 start_codon:yes stop_codon:yes gene_type:complete
MEGLTPKEIGIAIAVIVWVAFWITLIIVMWGQRCSVCNEKIAILEPRYFDEEEKPYHIDCARVRRFKEKATGD